VAICRELQVTWCVNPCCHPVGESMFAIVVENVCFDNNLNAAIKLPLPEN
jgi:fatty-acid desaturase